MSSGGGGGSSGVKYDNLEKLYGTQQQAAGFMLDQAMSRLPGSLENSATMVDDAMSGTLGQRAANMAGADAQQSFGANLDAVNRNMARYGAEFNPARMQKAGQDAALGGALNRANAMNKATQWAEDQKWNRNAGYYGQLSGMSTGAMQGMSSAGSGMSGLANMQNQNDMANARGYGQFGSALGAAVTKADGGYINAARMAEGGDAWSAYKAANPVQTGGIKRGKGTNQVLAIFGGAAPHVLGAGLKDLMKGGNSSLLKTGKDAYAAIKVVPQMFNGAQNMAQAGEFYDAAQASLNAGYTGAEALGMAAQGADYASSAQAAADAAEFADTASAASSAADTASAAGSTASWIGDGASSFGSILAMAGGGYVPKRSQGFALGGGVRSPIAKNGMDDMDASMAMPRVNQMDDKAVALPAQAQQAAVDTRHMGKTDGMGETSAGDPDGFGKEGPDNRHMAGKATMSVIGRWLGGPWGGLAGSALAEVVHPVGEAVSRGVITTGDKLGGSGGALVLDPIGTTFSGKYSNEDLAKGHLSVAAGMPWLSKFLADGGDVEPEHRADYTPGGKVAGPGTETSDDIPAWLSDGEFVLNAEAVKMIGKAKLEKFNAQGLKQREGKPAPKAKGRGLKLAKGGAAKKGC